MYPKSIKIESGNKIHEFVYRPAPEHDDEFEVISIENPEDKTIFSIDPIENTFNVKDENFSIFSDRIAEEIHHNEYINFRGEV